MSGLIKRLEIWGNLIKFSHSVFALPFAAIMALVAVRLGTVTWYKLLLLLVCLISARSAAMAFNRVVDSKIDSLNDRTKNREIPAGRVSLFEAGVLVVLASLVFVLGAFGLGVHCGVLSFPVLLVLLGYSYVKRYSSACHLVLGLALALAPGGVWYALTAEWSVKPAPLMFGVLLWVAGFDILYSCQDAEFDRENHLFSIPSRFGVSRALQISAALHMLSVLSLAVFGLVFSLGSFFWLGLVIFAVFIASQHVTVAKHGLESINQVFFLRNGAASVALFLFCFIDYLVG
jgi:4-hydroxybenzoate polyprenyltransferase